MDKLNNGFKVAVIGLAIIAGTYTLVKAISFVGQFLGVQAFQTQALQQHEARIQQIENFLIRATQQQP